MSNRELPMMPWFPKEFRAATSTWTFAERNAYRELLDIQWEEGAIPDEPERLARAIGMSLSDFRKIWPKIRRKFEKVDGELKNGRLEEHRVTAARKADGFRKGAEIANAKRAAKHDATPHARRNARRVATPHASVTHPSPSPSETREEPSPPSTPGPVEGAGLPDGRPRNGSRANGTNPRALGTNPRARGTNPRVHRNRSLEAWRQIAAECDRISATRTLTWLDLKVDDTARRAGEIVGFRLIADRDKFNTSELQSRFREAYEREQARAAEHHEPAAAHT
jgi:uncharacterized protein YdaU (DUF1376 family)